MKFSLFFKGEYLKAFWGVQIFSLIYLLSIIRADVYYIDDMGRSMIPPAWDSNGRPLTTWLLELISDGLPVIDASPIPQLIGVGVLVSRQRVHTCFGVCYTGCVCVHYFATKEIMFLGNQLY